MSEEVLYTVVGAKTLSDMTWEEVGEILEETDTIIVPVGSTEQHGPHLPLSTDEIQSTELAKRTVALLAKEGIKVVAGPTIPFGTAPYHLDFPGTISLRSETLKAVIMDVCRSLYHHGFRRFALILGHGGNFSTMMVATEEIAQEFPDAKFAFLNDMPDLFTDEAMAPFLTSDKPEGHAGEGETARILLTHPNLVQMDRARIFYSSDKDKAEHDVHPAMGGGVMVHTLSWKAVTPIGSVGNPKLATAETGQRLYDYEVKWFAEAIKNVLLKE